MPVGEYRWLNRDEMNRIDWRHQHRQQTDVEEEGYILEVTLSYPPHLHIEHNSFPLAPEQKIIHFDLLSPYAKQCHQYLSAKTPTEGGKYKAKKLTATFEKRSHYVVHFSILQLYLQLGMQLEKVHRVLAFRQKAFLKTYIDYCTRKRSCCDSPFQKNIWKLCANAVFGKFIEQVRNRMTCSFITCENTFMRKIRRESFSHFRILDPQLVVLFQKQMRIKMDKAFAVGFTILEKSKEFMYRKYYFDVKPKFLNCKVLFSDTDSLCLCIEKESNGDGDNDQQNSLLKLKALMDFSNYDPSHLMREDERKNQLGYFKDELKGNVLKEFVGIRSKTYAMKILSNSLKKEDVLRRTKGITKGYRNTIPFEKFKQCIEQFSRVRLDQYQIRAKNHALKTLLINKLCFSSFDDKRFLLDCGIHSVPYGSILTKYVGTCPFCAKRLF